LLFDKILRPIMRDFILSIILFVLFNSVSFSQSDLWEDISEIQFTPVGERYIIPDSYRALKLNINLAHSLIKSAPMEFTPEALERKNFIPLPMPDGTFQNFSFWESPAMEPELQAKFPDIRTYTGQGIDNPYATLKFDLTPLGFHAQILSPNGRVFIDPHNKGDIHHYISYYTRDFKATEEFECQLFFHDQDNYEPGYSSFDLYSFGEQLRTYRLANAATGEYTIFHGGTVAAGLSAVTTSVNRVNGVYEREVAVRMVLVANNNLIIYTDPNTDPYTNNNGSTMLGQNQTNLDNVIGNANYDIGHVFSTGGGGVAYLGVVCVTNWKARGVTGRSSPVGDPFDIDYVAHEMGHQFGANHTFNGNAGSCNGNSNASTAYEPGSGSTIMAYAGICSPQNLQNNSDPYFHNISFVEIAAYITSGSGNSCPVTTNTGNFPPVVSSMTGGFTIPISTPFALTGSATDANGDTLTYCWEEFDLGPAGHPNSPSGNAPIFRSFTPVTSPTRTFPKLSDLLNNTQTMGEILPSYTRTLTFRLTARDNRAGGSGVDWKPIAFNVTSNAGPFLVTSPNTNVSWQGNTQQTVTWNVASTNVSPVSCSNVKILLSTNGGNSFNTVLAESTPNDGSQVVTIPNLPTTQARVKVEAVGNIFFDISNVNFTIINNPFAADPAFFSASAVSSSQVNLSFSTNPANNNVVIIWNNTGSFTTPTGAPPAPGNSFAGGTLLYNGTSSPQSHTGLFGSTTYYYKAFSYNGINYSPGLTANATTFVSTFQHTVPVENGWNLVSIPGLHPVNQNVNTWWAFRDPGADVFKFDGSYTSVSTVQPGTGYWMKHVGNRTYNTGDEWPSGGIQYVPNNPINVFGGWNLIGGYDYIAAVSGITTNPPGINTGLVYSYSSAAGYQSADELVPGYGYWINVTAPGIIYLPDPTFRNTKYLSEHFNENTGRIIITDNGGKCYTLYTVKDKGNLDLYKLPPLPHSGMFDIRFSSGRFVEDISSSKKSIELSGVEYPVKLRAENITINIYDEGERIVFSKLESGEEIIITNHLLNKIFVSEDILPSKFSLEQNYPNPFNPVTTIRFSLPEDVENVKLTIYDALGQKAAELVNAKLEAGQYSFYWDAANYVSGIYLYELRTEKFISTKKMILLR
jgi:hypothetical protein